MSRLTRSLALGVLALVLTAGCSDAPTAPDLADAARWRTWVIADASALRPPPPPAPGSPQARAELDEVLRLQAQATPAVLEEVRRWGALPTGPWTNEAIDLLERYWILLPDVRTASPARSARIMALLHVAMYDALVATWEAKAVYGRPSPAAQDRRVRRLRPGDASPSYPSEHAAAAAAAAEVLKYAFELEDSARFNAMARRAGEAQLVAGLAYRSDVEAGWELGRRVAQAVLERARRDGSAQAWDGVVPEGPAVWRPTPPRLIRSPFDPMAGRWRTWVIADGSAFRPPPPPGPATPEFRRDLEELRRLPAQRTPEQANAARYWATDAPSAWWELFAEEEIVRRGLSPLHAARAHALVSVAIYDAFVSAWDAKFHYWLLRPISADGTLRPLFSTPPFPSYPSGHSTISTAAAEVFAYLFPDRAEHYRERAHEASLSRIWGVVHFRFDCEVGAEMGKKVGQAVVAYARRDGAHR